MFRGDVVAPLIYHLAFVDTLLTHKLVDVTIVVNLLFSLMSMGFLVDLK
jgi:hypothetical protein